MAGTNNNVDPSPNSGNGSVQNVTNGGHSKPGGPPNATSKAAAQLQKMKDANTKYKNLLKMAKERIEQQEIELKDLRENEHKRADEDATSKGGDEDKSNPLDDENDLNNGYWNLIRVSQLIRVDLDGQELTARGLSEEIWALCTWEREETDEQKFLLNHNKTSTDALNNRKRLWKRFDSEADLADFIRRDTGEPLVLPPYSLNPQQSSRITVDAERKVSVITEEYRRFRVKSEMTRKQLESQIRDMQSSQVESTKRQIEGIGHVDHGLEATRRTESNQLERLRAEAARQEDQWKEAYDILLKENEALKSSGSEAILASQWRQRYEACLKEKEEAVHKLQSLQQRHEQHKQQQHSASFSSPPNIRGGKSTSDGKYEMKYRDLKESFRLYRKKAKEIFESQAAAAASNNSAGGRKSAADMMVLQMSQQNTNADEDSKLSYLKNLMVNYLTADPEVRDHMETAIGTVLKFTPAELNAIKKKKEEDSGWGAYIGYT